MPLRSTMQPAPYSVAEPRQIVTGDIALIAIKRCTVSASGSSEEPGLYSPCQHERECTACGKNDANIEEMIADGGFGFHAKVK